MLYNLTPRKIQTMYVSFRLVYEHVYHSCMNTIFSYEQHAAGGEMNIRYHVHFLQ